jgi:hypothetical protein
MVNFTSCEFHLNTKECNCELPSYSFCSDIYNRFQCFIGRGQSLINWHKWSGTGITDATLKRHRFWKEVSSWE